MLTNWVAAVEDSQYLEMIFNNISDMVFLVSMNDDGNFHYVTANQTAVEGLDFPENFREKKINDLIPRKSAQVITEKYREAIAKQETITYQTNIEFPTSKGALSPRFSYVESKVTPILNKQGNYDHIIAVTRDVTDWVEQEKQLKHANKQVELMFNHAADAVFMFDEEAAISGKKEGKFVAKRILRAMEKPFKVHGYTLPLTTSIGITFSNNNKTIEQLFKESDEALYDAKATGKNVFCIY